ncbi:IS1634 family transposase, partial [Lentibacillus kapialis]|uniref:IS1634 family transposase n=1 Tax=Lentibacillus kapialis TaxID=340214 RepID=UPI0016629F5B
FGSERKADDFNDDALGRALDALYAADPEKVYIQAVQGIQKAIPNLSLDRLHYDTTSFVYTGQPKEEDDRLQIVRGYSKDHRHDLPQIKFGIGTNAEGIPLYGETLDGNQDDKKWNAHFLKALTNWFSPETLANAIFIADSAFVTKENLQELKRDDEPDLRFLSRLPENFKLAGDLKEKAWEQDEWEKVGTLADGKDAAIYQISRAKAKLDGEAYRFLIVHSNKLDGRKQKSIDAQLEKEQQKWEKDKEKLEKKDFACERDARDALSEFIKDHKGSHTIEGTIVPEQRAGKREKRGRPKKGETPPSPVTVYTIQLTIHAPSEEQLERLRQQASTFILVTNEMNEQELPDIELLRAYKGQQTVENRFRFLKNPYFVGRVFLEKPKRVEAFAYVMMLSVMVYSVFEFLIRKNMENEDEPLDLMGGSRKSFRPTGEAVLEILDTMDVVHFKQEDKLLKRVLPEDGKGRVSRILNLLGMNEAVFTQPQDEKGVEKTSK